MIPRIRSFRVRIALMSSLLSAIVLLAFGLWTWNAVQRTSMRRIDQTIRELGDRHLGTRQGPQHWQQVRESLEFVLGDLSANPFILLVKGRDGSVINASENWPQELAPESFSSPVDAGFTEDPGPLGPGHGRRFGWGRRGQRGPDDALREPSGAPPPPEGDSPRDMPFPPPLDMGRLGPPNQVQRPFGPPQPPIPVRAQEFLTARAMNVQWRIGVMSNPFETLVLGLNLASYNSEMVRLRRLFLMAIPGVLILIALGGWWLAQRALRPIETLTLAAEGITARGLDTRIPLGQEDQEFERLIVVFNNMLDRLEKSFHQAVRFSADAAHELKTPLTILQGELAEAVQTATTDSDHQQTLGRLLEEVQRLKSITRKLLLLSLADSGQLKPQEEIVNLSDMVQASVEDIQVMAPELRVNVDVDAGLCIKGDPDLIRQVIQNLTSNSIKYNVSGGTVAMELKRGGDRIRLRIGNSGPGIPDADRDRVFERFYRADKARNRQVDGIGLGLSLAREIVRAHHGELTLDESRDGWTVFSVILPGGKWGLPSA